jgi:hypothetical protein
MSKDKGDFTNAFAPVPHLSGVCCCMSIATSIKWKAVGVDLTQGFIQAELPKDGKAIYLPTSWTCRGERRGISGLEASVWHAAFGQMPACHVIELAGEPGLQEGRIRG